MGSMTNAPASVVPIKGPRYLLHDPGSRGRWPTGIGMTPAPCHPWSGGCCRWSRWVAG